MVYIFYRPEDPPFYSFFLGAAGTRVRYSSPVWETEAHGRDGHFVPWQLMKTWMKHGFILEIMMKHEDFRNDDDDDDDGDDDDDDDEVWGCLIMRNSIG